MNLKPLFFVFALSIIFTSCSRVYSPALYHHDVDYMPTPMSFDSAKTATYASIGYNDYSNANGGDEIESGELNISEGYNFKNFNLAYGAFGAIGSYENGQ